MNTRKNEYQQSLLIKRKQLKERRKRDRIQTTNPGSPRSSDILDDANADDDTLVSVNELYNTEQSSKGKAKSWRPNPNLQQQQQTSSYNSLNQLQHDEEKKSRFWLEEEKSDKINNNRQPPVTTGSSSYLTASSSEYDTDKDSGGNPSSLSNDNGDTLSPQHNNKGNNNQNHFPYYSRTKPHHRAEDDDKTFDYGSRDDTDSYSAGSGSYAARRQKEAERRRKALAEAQLADSSQASNAQKGESTLINKEDVEHFKKSLDSPAMRIGAGVAGAATLGVVVGPVGLLVGAAVVSIGFSLSQIPEEDRNRMQESAKESFQDFQEKACDATETLGNTCAAHYKDSGVAEHIPSQMAEHLPTCLSAPDTNDVIIDDQQGDINQQLKTNQHPTTLNNKNAISNDQKVNSNPNNSSSKEDKTNKSSTTEGGAIGSGEAPAVGAGKTSSGPGRPMMFKTNQNKKVACLRNGKARITQSLYYH